MAPRRAYTSISILVRGSASPHTSVVAAGRTSPKYRRRTVAWRGDDDPLVANLLATMGKAPGGS
ncbi:hypothetical protein SAMN05421810_103385 [Amycolatopsis arida]|uniref:Uncharacterized protein n=1 Tax=Amycolatopsis arida TaxID=587909 RepID=A0A1I5T5M9_9PSEU|nr:hypothetical protein [Amycolatopsis arida]TDX96236.1 hypothetical protein CLV69_103373 [Amycolatopsis arida]SFP77816.1 hypothetical protein SAMN05421810_103385 [Amycolatopsis arida]